MAFGRERNCDWLLPVAQRVDRLIHDYGVEPFRKRFDRWAAEFLGARDRRDDWIRRREEHALAYEFVSLIASAFDRYDRREAVSKRFSGAPDDCRLVAAYFPEELAHWNEPTIQRPLPIPDDREPSMDEKVVVMGAIRDALERGERIVSLPPGSHDRPAFNRAAAAFVFIRSVTELVDPTDLHKLELWYEDVESFVKSELHPSASIDSVSASNAVKWESSGAAGGTITPTRSKRSTERGEGRTKLIAALTKHHKYADGGSLNLEPIGNNELARLAGVDRATASAFFKQQFKGHGKYKAVCADAARLAAALKLLNGEFAPHLLYGSKPGNEDERDEE
ncbi:MAG: hypothetical protein SGJ19_29640 [Planctomycetia bacterium]|nr:hypothetical protein [Planctomycetia bacterium]